MSDDVQYPYLPEGKTFQFVPGDNPFMQAAKKAADERAGDRINPVGVALVKDGKILVTSGNGHDLGRGHVHICPRVVLECKTGEGYDLCHFHQPEGHAEPSAVKAAREQGIDIDGADAYMYGHWWACEPCWKVLLDAGLNHFYILEDAHVAFDKKNVHKRTLTSSIKSLYMSGGLTHAPAEVRDLYNELQAEVTDMGLDMYCPHQHSDPQKGTEHSPEEIYEMDKKLVAEKDVTIAYVGSPSYGVGMEIEMAHSAGKPIVLIHEEGKKVPRIVGGCPSVVYTIEFSDISDARKKLKQVLRQL